MTLVSAVMAIISVALFFQITCFLLFYEYCYTVYCALHDS